MLHTVEVTSSQGELLSLPFEDSSSGFAVKDIEGLDPVPAQLVSSSFANMDGEQYQSSRREKRNIIITIRLDPDHSITSVRQLRAHLYNFFMPKSEVGLKFLMTGETPLLISGRVETFDANLFVKEPEATISIINYNPDFYEEFPILINTASTTTSDYLTHNYQGTIDTGLTIKVTVTTAMPNGFMVSVRLPGGAVENLQYNDPLEVGDILTIVTDRGSKSVEKTSNSITESFLYKVTPQSAWIRFYPGINQIRVQGTGAALVEVSYTNKYGGL